MTYSERIGQMLQALEDKGYNLYWDEVLREWELFNPKSDYSVRSKDKFSCIQQGFRDLIH